MIIISICFHHLSDNKGPLTVISFVFISSFLRYLILQYEYTSSKWPSLFERQTSFVENSCVCVSKLAALLAYWPVHRAIFVTLRRRFGVTVESEHVKWKNEFFTSGTNVPPPPYVASCQRRTRCVKGHLRAHSVSRVFSQTNCICLAACIRDAGSLHDKNPSGRLSSLTIENLADVRLRLTDLFRKPINHSVTGRD